MVQPGLVRQGIRRRHGRSTICQQLNGTGSRGSAHPMCGGSRRTPSRSKSGWTPTRGLPGEAWQGYFGRKVEELGANAVWGKMERAVTGSPHTPGTRTTSRASLTRSTSPSSMRTTDMSPTYCPTSWLPRQREEQKAAEAEQSQAGLDELAAKFASRIETPNGLGVLPRHVGWELRRHAVAVIAGTAGTGPIRPL